MCGIIAYHSNKNDYREEIRSALQSLRHRGPDEASIWHSEQANIGLAHARLKLVAGANGQQPIRSHDSSTHCIVNGEFYGYESIRKHYINKGYTFYTDSDSEILLPLYIEHGFNCLNHLNGEFAFILWDSKRNLIFAARDRFGVKPLHYINHNGEFFLASEIKAILKFKIPARWNSEALMSFFAGVPQSHFSCFEGIHTLKPAHYLIYNGTQSKEFQYWQPRPSTCQNVDEEFAAMKTQDLLRSAVQTRLHGEHPVGVYLSGGIDSSSLLALMTETKKDTRAFTISFDDFAHDECASAEALCKQLKVDLSVLKINFSHIADNYSNVIYHRESPVYQISGIGKFLLSQFVNANGIRAVLTGEGADEILLGYPSFKEDMLLANGKQGNYRNLLNVRNIEKAYVSEGNYSHLSIVEKLLGYIPAFLKLSHDICAIMGNFLNPPYQQYLNSYEPIKKFILLHSKSCMSLSENVEKSSYLWSKSFFPELILSYLGDRVEMAHSVEARLPFLDMHFVEWASTLPSSLKIKDLNEKYILRKAMSTLLPLETVKRPKQIYAAPNFLLNLDNPIYGLLMDILHSDQFKQLPFFNANKIKSCLSQLPAYSERQIIILEFALNLVISTHFLANQFHLSI